jgi:hypothetical protein
MIKITANQGFGWVSYSWAQRVGETLYARHGFDTAEAARMSAETIRADLELVETLQARLNKIGKDLRTARGSRRVELERERRDKLGDVNQIKRRIYKGAGDGE